MCELRSEPNVLHSVGVLDWSPPLATTFQLRFERARFPAALSNSASPCANRPRPRAARNSKRVSASKSANRIAAISSMSLISHLSQDQDAT